jgi:hypothetical protein
MSQQAAATARTQAEKRLTEIHMERERRLAAAQKKRDKMTDMYVSALEKELKEDVLPYWNDNCDCDKVHNCGCARRFNVVDDPVVVERFRLMLEELGVSYKTEPIFGMGCVWFDTQPRLAGKRAEIVTDTDPKDVESKDE